MNSHAESTATLLIRARAGDAAARENLFARYLAALRRWAHGRLPWSARDMAETDDLVQLTLMRAFQSIDRFEPRREGAFLAYLRRILLNQLRDEIRRRKRRPDQEPIDERAASPLPSTVEQAIGVQMTERYEDALEQLDPRQAEAVILRIEFGYEFAEIAEAIEAPSANAARMVVSRALVRLAEILDEAG